MSTEKIKVCVGYCRISSKPQDIGDSLEYQENFLKTWVEKYDDFHMVKVFTVIESASKPERPHLFECFKYCIKNGIKDILVTESDRWTRSQELDILATKFIKKHDLKVHILKDRKIIGEAGTAFEKFTHRLSVGVAELYSDQLREKVLAGLEVKIGRNELPCLAPIGYTNIPRTNTSGGKCIPDENFGKVKKFLLIFLEGGRTLTDMEKVAKNIGLKSKRGGELRKPSIRWMLRNPFYSGEFGYAGKLYPNKTAGFMPMITKKQYEKILKILDNMRLHKFSKKGTQWKYRDLVHCGKCGRILLANKFTVKYKRKTGKAEARTYTSYHCSRGHYFEDERDNLIARDLVHQDELDNHFYKENGKVEYVKRKKCNTGCIIETDLGKLLTSEFGVLKFKRNKWNKIKASLLKDEKHSRKLIAEELQMIRSEYSKNKTKQETLYEDKLNGVIKENFFKGQMDKIDDRQLDIKGRIEELEEDEKFYDNKIQHVLEAIESVDNFKDKFIEAETPEIRKLMVNMMCNKILITGGERISSTKKKIPYILHVEWNDEFKELYNIDLFELPEEMEVKYGLPKKTFINSKNSL